MRSSSENRGCLSSFRRIGDDETIEVTSSSFHQVEMTVGDRIECPRVYSGWVSRRTPELGASRGQRPEAHPHGVTAGGSGRPPGHPSSCASSSTRSGPFRAPFHADSSCGVRRHGLARDMVVTIAAWAATCGKVRDAQHLVRACERAAETLLRPRAPPSTPRPPYPPRRRSARDRIPADCAATTWRASMMRESSPPEATPRQGPVTASPGLAARCGTRHAPHRRGRGDGPGRSRAGHPVADGIATSRISRVRQRQCGELLFHASASSRDGGPPSCCAIAELRPPRRDVSREPLLARSRRALGAQRVDRGSRRSRGRGARARGRLRARSRAARSSQSEA